MKKYKDYDYLVNLHGINDHIKDKRKVSSKIMDLKHLINTFIQMYIQII